MSIEVPLEEALEEDDEEARVELETAADDVASEELAKDDAAEDDAIEDDAAVEKAAEDDVVEERTVLLGLLDVDASVEDDGYIDVVTW